MRVVIFGATGMVGQGVLRECLRDEGVTEVLAVVRHPIGKPHAKLREIVHADFHDFTAIADRLSRCDACFFCIGVTSAGTSEADYVRVTHDIAVAAGRALAKAGMTIVFVSGSGADENSRIMWARVKGQTETALRAMPFKAVYVVRPGYIQPMHGITSRTRWYRILYALAGPFYPVWKALLPGSVTTTETLGRAMIRLAREGAPAPVLHNRDINRLDR